MKKLVSMLILALIVGFTVTDGKSANDPPGVEFVMIDQQDMTNSISIIDNYNPGMVIQYQYGDFAKEVYVGGDGLQIANLYYIINNTSYINSGDNTMICAQFNKGLHVNSTKYITNPATNIERSTGGVGLDLTALNIVTLNTAYKLHESHTTQLIYVSAGGICYEQS
jgi:hypothetical protein